MGNEKSRRDKDRRGAPGPAGAGQGAVAATGAASKERLYLLVAGAIVLAMVAVVMSISPTHVVWQDDQYTDMNIRMGGENFATHGFFRLDFLPVHYVGGMGDPPVYYTHYPPLPEIVNGLMRLCGIDGLTGQRMLLGLMLIAGLAGMCAGLSRAMGPLAAVCGLGMVGTSGFFFNYSISLHHSLSLALLGLFVWCFMRAIEDEHSPRRWWAGAWAGLFLASLCSFEYILLPQAFAWVYALATGKLPKKWRPMALMLTAPVIGVGLHFMQNIAALGWSAALEDAADAFIRPGRGGVQSRWQALAAVPAFLVEHGQRNFYWTWAVLPVVAMVCLAVRSRQEADKPSSIKPLAGVLLGAVLGGATWYFFMPVHTLKHPHTLGQLVLPMMAVMGSLMAILLGRLWRPGTLWSERALIVAALLTVVYGQYHSIRDTLDRTRLRPESFPVFEAIGGGALPEKCAALTNTYADAQLAYFIRRPVLRSPGDGIWPFPESIQDFQAHLPKDWPVKYYLFDLRFFRSNPDLFQMLATYCPGEMIGIPGQQYQPVLVKFDLTPLRAPKEQWKPIREIGSSEQELVGYIRGLPIWKLPGYEDRLIQAWNAQMGSASAE